MVCIEAVAMDAWAVGTERILRSLLGGQSGVEQLIKAVD